MFQVLQRPLWELVFVYSLWRLGWFGGWALTEVGSRSPCGSGSPCGSTAVALGFLLQAPGLPSAESTDHGRWCPTLGQHLGCLTIHWPQSLSTGQSWHMSKNGSIPVWIAMVVGWPYIQQCAATSASGLKDWYQPVLSAGLPLPGPSVSPCSFTQCPAPGLSPPEDPLQGWSASLPALSSTGVSFPPGLAACFPSPALFRPLPSMSTWF